MKRLCAFMLSAAMLLCVFATPLAAAEDKPSLYFNDEVWYKSGLLMPVRMFNLYYLPVSVFASFDYINVTLNRQKKELLLANKNTGRYVSFNIDEQTVITDEGDELYVRVYAFYAGEYYVPANFVCGVLGVQNEAYVSPVDGDWCVRVYDSTAKLTFKELLKIHNPDALPPETETTTETTQPPETTTDTTAPVTTDVEVDTEPRMIALVFDYASGGEYDDTRAAIEKTLSAYRIGAVFVFGPEDAQSARTAASLLTSGYRIAAAADADARGDDAADSLDAVNEYLYTITKTTTRLASLTDKQLADEATVAAVELRGYRILRFNAEAPDSGYYSAKVAASMTETIIKSADITLMRLRQTKITAAMLSAVLDIILAHPNYTVFVPGYTGIDGGGTVTDGE